MGNTACCGQNQKLGGTFDSAMPFKIQEMVVVKDEQLQDNLLKNKLDAPSAGYGRKVNERPKLLTAVSEARHRELEAKQLDISNQSTGIALPPYYLNKFKAYYEGTWKKGLPNGVGKLYFENGCYFEGLFVNGEITGEDGLYFYPDGSLKRGSVKNGKLEGHGKFVSKTGGFVYEGNWVNDKPNGEGVELYPDGSRYEGHFVDGVKNDDNAAYRWANGKVYTGPFKNGYMEGQGKLVMEKGKGEYIGEFSRNLKVGHGKMRTQTGQYQGPFENGDMHGTGVFKWFDGKIYQGQFYKGELHGSGTLIYPNGQVAKGNWHHGQNLELNAIDRLSKMQA